MAFLPLNVDVTEAAAAEKLNVDTAETKHNWKEYSTDYEIIEVGTHEYTYWKNFIRHKRTCHISHRIKTVVYYCDIHDHTKSETFLEEIIHSEKHRD
ncbi:hypothetical protein GMD78_17635 [Ornithinibacillus sp. L9]|uniref:Uncharacterized protein n=1 Tax=Ornithinibacillus caprae TaxID=2678566 RepID=A0A6N8FPU0_9BACI|nr:hypothetical protein [Ornithinibacillus caprae]